MIGNTNSAPIIEIKGGDCMSSYLTFVENSTNIDADAVSAALGKNNENEIKGVGKALAMTAKFYGWIEDINISCKNLIKCNTMHDIVKNNLAFEEYHSIPQLVEYFESNDYVYDIIYLGAAIKYIYTSEGKELTVDSFNKPSNLMSISNTDDGLKWATGGSGGAAVATYTSNDSFTTDDANYLRFTVVSTNIDSANYNYYFGISADNKVEILSKNSYNYKIDVSGIESFNLYAAFPQLANKSIVITDIFLSKY